MSELTKSEIKFLEAQGVGLNLIFNAKGLKRSEWQAEMREESKIIAYNTSPCKAKGHKLRTRGGHCVQCDTAKLGFQKRNDKAGIVYIAGTKTGKLTKIGFTDKPEIRKESLNRTKYGNFSDWEILFAISCTKAGAIESKIKTELKKYSEIKKYKHNGKEQTTDEIYRCSYSKAKITVKKITENGDFNSSIIIDKNGINYEFPNLARK